LERRVFYFFPARSLALLRIRPSTMLRGHSIKRPEIITPHIGMFDDLQDFHRKFWPLEKFCDNVEAFEQMLAKRLLITARLSGKIVGYARIAGLHETCPESPMYRYLHAQTTPLHGMQAACVRITVDESFLGGSTWFRLLDKLLENCGRHYQVLCTQAEPGSREEQVLASLLWQKADDPDLPVWLLRIRPTG
jgi:hypothetical protein